MRKLPAVLLLLLLVQGVQAQQARADRDEGRQAPVVQLRLTPALQVPLGSDAGVYGIGFGADLSGELSFATFPLSLSLGAGYQFSPVKADISLSLLTAAAGMGARFTLVPGLSAHGRLRGGLAYSFVNEEPVSGTAPFLEAGAGVQYLLGRRTGLGLEAAYRSFPGLSQGLSFALGISYLLAPSPGKSVELRDIDLRPVYPVFYKYYDSHPLGTAVLSNGELGTIDRIRVTVFVEEYMSNPKTVEVPGRIRPGQRLPIDLFGLFNQAVMGISEGTIVSAKIDLQYALKGKTFQREYVESLRLHNRNALSWDDDRKVAAFVTAKDPVVLKLAKNTVGVLQRARTAGMNESFLKAMSLHAALETLGLSYVIDPSTPHQEFSRNQSALDYLQFPRQSLDFRAGDCDDLSILYCALLEATGVETAFITVPGHIFMALCLGPSDDPSLKTLNTDELILREKKAWLPVETTEIKGGFLRAWQLAARQWREFQARGEAGFYPLHEAWRTYEPVAFAVTEASVEFPSPDALAQKFSRRLEEYVQRQIGAQAAQLETLLRQRPADARLRNQLAVLYARYGLYEQAETELKKALERQDYLPALLNLGNLHSLRGAFAPALEAYRRAQKLDTGSPAVLLGLARVHNELGEYDTSMEYYNRLAAADPGLAARYNYLDSRRDDPTRAAEGGRLREAVQWQEEP